MKDNDFFVVDMTNCQSTGEIINCLSLALETLNHSGKKIVLKLNDVYLNQSQLLSIQSLITSWGCILDTIETTNKETASVAENMNILVQKPIENRVQQNAKDSEISFTPFTLNKTDAEEIAVKEVNGLHFEADLDRIKENQDNIDIQSDFEKAGISTSSDFNEIEQQISKHYMSAEDLTYKQNQPTEEDKQCEIEDADKKSISVYRKAYDIDNSNTENDWEEVEFYETPTTDPVVLDSKSTTYINQTLRSGQVIDAEGNVVVIGDCHPGSEIRATGDITVWGILSGIAHAGSRGNLNAKVRALKLNAVQLRIGSCYSRRPDGTNIPYVIRSSIFTPEEARVVDNEIILFKINQN